MKLEFNPLANWDKPQIPPSPLQQAIYDYCDNGPDTNVMIKGVAGCGKTTTLENIVPLLPGRVCVCCFNKNIADELRERMPPTTDCSTIHSLGINICRQLGWFKVNGNKVNNVLKYEVIDYDHATDEYKELYYKNKKNILRCVSLLKAEAFDPCNTDAEYIDAINRISDLFAFDIPSICERVIIRTYKESTRIFCTAEHSAAKGRPNPKKVIDFDDMLFYPVYYNLEFPQYDYVLVDEAQDLNVIQRLFIKKLIKNGGKIIVVGDPNQSIYAFRGASPTSMEDFEKDFSPKELPLSICYRCADPIIQVAQTYVPRIQGTGKAGLVKVIPETSLLDTVTHGSFILCRVNAPLVKHALDLLRIGMPASILGRDIVSGIVALAKEVEKKYRVLDVDGISNHIDALVAKLHREEKPYEANAVEERGEILKILTTIGEVTTSKQVKQTLEKMYADSENPGVTLSTVHRVKGMQADNVFIVKPELMPFPKASQEWEIVQEYNILYVAVTRAKTNLYYVEGK